MILEFDLLSVVPELRIPCAANSTTKMRRSDTGYAKCATSKNSAMVTGMVPMVVVVACSSSMRFVRRLGIGFRERYSGPKSKRLQRGNRTVECAEGQRCERTIVVEGGF